MKSTSRPLGDGSTYHLYFQVLVESKIAEAERLRAERKTREEKAARVIEAWMNNTVSPLETAHPTNTREVWRCIYVLKTNPDYAERLDEMATLSNEWRAIVEHWQEIEKLCRDEWPNYDAPKCQARLDVLLKQGNNRR